VTARVARRAWPGEERPAKRYKRSAQQERLRAERRRVDPSLTYFMNCVREVLGLDPLVRCGK
jgi:hypothetical protein